jgi:sulfonate transport system permease protein
MAMMAVTATTGLVQDVGPVSADAHGSSRGSAGWRWARRLAGPLLLLGIWQVGSWTGLIPTRNLASPGRVAAAAWDLIKTGELQHHLAVSLVRAVKGLAIGVTIGTVLAVVSGLWRVGEDFIDAPMQMLRTLPFVALVPLFILWFGIGDEAKIALIVLGTAFPMYINTFSGIRSVDAKLVEAARTVGLSRFGLVKDVVLPGALPSALVGLRYSMTISVLALVVAEQINATAGIGYLITNARDFLQTDVIVVGLIVYALLGLAADLIVRLLERTLLGWRRGFTGA